MTFPISSLPTEILHLLLDHISDYYSIRNMCLAYPEIAAKIAGAVGYFVFHGRFYPINFTPNYTTNKGKFGSFEEWFKTSLSLDGKVPPRTNIRQYSLVNSKIWERKRYSEKEEDKQFYRYPTTLGNYDIRNHFQKKAHSGFYDSDSGWVPKSPLRQYKEKEEINLSIHQKFEHMFYDALFENKDFHKWFRSIIKVQNRFRFLVFVLSCPEHSVLIDMCWVLEHLYRVHQPLRPFSIISIKNEWTQRWQFMDLGSKNENFLSLFDFLVDLDVKYDDSCPNELVFDLFFDSQRPLRYFQCTESTALGPCETRKFHTWLDREVSGYTLPYIRRLQSNRRTGAWPNDDKPPDICSLKEFKSFDVVFLRNHEVLYSTKNGQRRLESVLNTRKDIESYQPAASIYDNLDHLRKNVDKIGKTLKEILVESKINRDLETFASEIGDPRCVKYTGGFRGGVEVAYMQLQMYKDIMSQIPWLAKDTLMVRMSIFKSEDNRSDYRERFLQYESKLREAYSKIEQSGEKTLEKVKISRSKSIFNKAMWKIADVRYVGQKTPMPRQLH